MKLFFEHSGHKIEFELIYRNRKSICIKISPQNGVVVHAPKSVKPDEILKILKSKSRWILKKLTEINSIKQIIIRKEFIDGEKFLFLGEEHNLQILFNPNKKRPNIMLDYGKLILETNSSETIKIKKYLEDWYRGKALETILERILYYQQFLEVRPKAVKVKTQQSRWGSCNSKGNLYFNWKIIMSPIEILDYLVVHEMAHLIHLNHSSKFWNLVARILPDYKTSRKILKKFGSTYTL